MQSLNKMCLQVYEVTTTDILTKYDNKVGVVTLPHRPHSWPCSSDHNVTVYVTCKELLSADPRYGIRERREYFDLLFVSKLRFGRILDLPYQAIWRCSSVWL